MIDPATFGRELEGRGFSAFSDLFGPRTVAIATFFCSPIADATLLGWNLHRTRRTSLALVAIVAALLAIVVAIPTGAAGGRIFMIPITFGGIYFLGRTTRALFGDR